MSYTSMRVTARGVVLRELHAARLGGSPALQRRFDELCASAEPGLYVVRAVGDELLVERRNQSRLADGQPVRCVPSPIAHETGPRQKPAPPSRYDEVRLAGVTTLLTDAHGKEVYESCVASVVTFDGRGLVLTPESSPRVASLAEAFIAQNFPVRRAPIPVQSDWALLLVNALKTAEPERGLRAAFPPELRAELERAFEESASRPG